jgi:hypothetical protein
VKAAEIIKEATAAGVRIAIEGDGLLLEATTAPPKAMIALITQHKAEIINQLRAGPAGLRKRKLAGSIWWLPSRMRPVVIASGATS